MPADAGRRRRQLDTPLPLQAAAKAPVAQPAAAPAQPDVAAVQPAAPAQPVAAAPGADASGPAAGAFMHDPKTASGIAVPELVAADCRKEIGARDKSMSPAQLEEYCLGH